MIAEVLIAVIAGIMAGVVTGLIPGVHVNLVAALMLASSGLISADPLVLATFIVALATTHSFLDFLPSTFLGVPDSGTELAVLPAHKMVLKGNGKRAVVLSLVGSLLCLVAAAVLSPLLLAFVGVVYPMIAKRMGLFLLVLVSLLFIRDWNTGKSLFVFILAGIFGLLVLRLPHLDSPLFPLLSGMFGVSILMESLREQSIFPKQSMEEVQLESAKSYGLPLIAATTAGAFTSIFPGLGAAQGASLTQSIVKDSGTEKYLVLVGGINTVNFVLSLVTLVTVQKARNGAVAAISELISLSMNDFWILLGAALVAGGLATPLGIFLTKGFCIVMPKLPYRKLVLGVISLIVILTLVLSGPYGFLVLTVSTALGLWTASLKVRKHFQMGCLILPVLAYFLL